MESERERLERILREVRERERRASDWMEWATEDWRQIRQRRKDIEGRLAILIQAEKE